MTYSELANVAYVDVHVADVKPGDEVFVQNGWRRVQRLETFWLGSTISDTTIKTSTPPHHRWPVMKLELVGGYLNILRFPHELLKRRERSYE